LEDSLDGFSNVDPLCAFSVDLPYTRHPSLSSP